jgi:hypothetical protein
VLIRDLRARKQDDGTKETPQRAKDTMRRGAITISGWGIYCHFASLAAWAAQPAGGFAVLGLTRAVSGHEGVGGVTKTHLVSVT